MPATFAEQQALFAAAEAYFQAAPWRNLPGEIPIVVEHDRTDQTSLCISMGAAGSVRGLAAYQGEPGRAGYELTMRLAEDPEEAAALDPSWMMHLQHVLKMEFVDAAERRPGTKKLHRELGLKFRGRMRYPQADVMRPGYFPDGDLDSEQTRWLTDCLEAVTAVAYWDYAELTALGRELWETDTHLVLTRAGTDWTSRVTVLLPVAPWAMLPELTLPQFAPPPPSANGKTLLLAVVPMETPVRDHLRDLPYFPLLCLAVDGRSGRVLVFETVTPTELPLQYGEWLTAALLTLGPVAATLLAADEPTRQLTLPIVAPRGYEVEAAPDHPHLRELLMHLRMFQLNHADDASGPEG